MERFCLRSTCAQCMVPANTLSGSFKGRSLKQRQRILPQVSIVSHRKRFTTKALYNPQEDPIAQKALKEPLAFLGGVFAGLLRLDLKEDPLREWVARTAEAAGLDKEEAVKTEIQKDEAPQQIEIS
eukprot:TRINITY_DN1894_c0_g1_i2.p1 TRINITY_DN1894_c0_g1~~TRINITY_DN1894_c0_g1_i2.p1  ORF type:complete len:126 (-),score=22.65 TRINITY_DN1894_c0_g1_i2:102-479(-)